MEVISKLATVGTPLDEACRLEGLLKVIQSRSTDLQKGIEENRKMENHLRRQLEAALEAKETHPVVADSPSPEEYLYEPSKSSSFDSISHTHPTSTDQRITEPVLQTPERSSRARHVFEGCGAANRKEGNSASLSSLSISLDNSDAHRPFPQHRSKGRDGASVPGCGTTLLVDTGYLFYYSGSEDDDNIDTNSNTTRRSGTDIERTPSLLRTPTPTSSFDGINFRTGLSGHRALTIAKTGGQYTPPRGMRLMMSQHRGVTNTRLHRGGPPMPPSLTFTNSPLK